MVQRKVVNKLGSKAESSTTHVVKPCSSHQNHDSRNKGGGEIRKKTMKSRSFKASDIDSLRRSMRRDQPRIKKPSVDASKLAPPPKKASPITTDGAPNYMKSTSCSNARRESLQLKVSPKSQTSTSNNKNSKNSMGSKPSSASGLVPKRVLKRNSSLKSIRPSLKKSSGVALNIKKHASRATCSSTLKDSKFPPYVELHPGGTESEGPSIMRVCPYDYCSLNGLRHAASPPLKRFLLAKRRLLRTQKSMKLKLQSSPGRKKLREVEEEKQTGDVTFDEDPLTWKPVIEIPPMVEVYKYNDFFVEIFAKTGGKIAESGDFDGNNIKNDDPQTPEVLKEASPDREDETPPPPPCSESSESDREEDDDDDCRLIENLSDEPSSTTNDEYNLVRNSGFVAHETNVSKASPEDCQFRKAEEVSDCWIELDRAEAGYQCCVGNDKESESVFNADDKELGEEESASLDNLKSSASRSVSATLWATDDSPKACEEGSEEEITLRVHEDDAECVTSSFVGGAFEGNGVELDNGDRNSNASEVSDAAEEQFYKLADAENLIICSATTTTPSEDGNLTEYSNENATNPDKDNGFLPEHNQIGDNFNETVSKAELSSLECVLETEQGTNAIEEEHSSDQHLQEMASETAKSNDGSGVLGSQASDSVDEVASTSSSSQELVVRSDGVLEVQETEEEDPNGSSKLENFDFSETKRDKEDADDTNAETEVHQEAVSDQSIPTVSECEVKPQLDIDSVENHDLEKGESNRGDHHISKSMTLEVCDDAENYISTSATSEDYNDTTDEVQLENTTVSDSEETCVQSNTKSPRNGVTIRKGAGSKKPLPETCFKLKWKRNKVKRPVEDYYLKKFNPRPPRFLDPEPDPEAEKVDLRHQEIDERKNAEEWMIDYALRQAVTKLAPARKRRVALLVEAFETVKPLPKCEVHLQYPASNFTHVRPIQACN